MSLCGNIEDHFYLYVHVPIKDAEQRGMIRDTLVDHSRLLHYYTCMFMQYRVNSGHIATFGVAWLGYRQ